MREIHIKIVGSDIPYIVREGDIESFNESYHHWSTSERATWIMFDYKGGLLELNMKSVASIETKKSS